MDPVSTISVDDAFPQVLAALLDANQRLADIVGDGVGPWNEQVRDRAERAILGDVHRAPDGTWTRIDFDDVDWGGERSSNPGTLSMVMRRFHVLGPLRAGYHATGDERYALTARRFIEAFLRDDPTGEGWTPQPGDADTQYDIRIGVWLRAISDLHTSPAFDDAFIMRMLDAVRHYLRYLSQHVRPDRNIRFWHGEVLLISGLRLAAWDEAAAWRDQGRTIINDAVRRQVLPDGAHMEATPGYHDGIVHIVHELWKLAHIMPDLGLDVPTAKLAAMYDYSACATRPDGATISLHDSRYVEARTATRTDTLDARNAFRKEAGLPDEMPPTAACFAHAKQVFVRDDWSADATYLTLDAATRRSFHWHPSRNSITLFARGRALLVDPGYTFETDEFPRYGHRTAHHSTVNFNAMDQSESRADLRLATADGYSLIEGLYDGGYWPVDNHTFGEGVFGEHHRTLLWLHGRFGVVIDHVHHAAGDSGKPDIETAWQFSEGPVMWEPDQQRIITSGESGNLAVYLPLVLPGSQVTLHTGERDPMRGWLPIEWGRRCIPATLARVTARAWDPWQGDMATVLVPFVGDDAPEWRMEATGPEPVRDSRIAGRLWIEHDNGADLIVWTRRLHSALEHQHDVDTDASLVHLRLAPDRTVQGGLMVDGLTCRWRGEDVTQSLEHIDRLATSAP